MLNDLTETRHVIIYDAWITIRFEFGETYNKKRGKDDVFRFQGSIMQRLDRS